MRIASLLASATEILYGIGLGERVVAVSHECDFPAAVAGKPRVTVSFVDAAQSSKEIDDQVRAKMSRGEPLYDVDREKLRELAPDLIVTQAQCDVCAVRYDDVLELVRGEDGLRNTRVLALNPMSLDDIFADIQRVGEATGAIAAAQRYVDSLQQRVARVVETAAAADHKPRVACIEWVDPLMLAANWMPRLVELAGGENLLSAGDRHSTYNAWADVVRCDPEVVIVMPCGFDLDRALDEARVLAGWPGWQEMSAVKQQRVYAVDGNAYFNRSGPRIVDSLEILAALLHPDFFASPPASVARAAH